MREAIKRILPKPLHHILGMILHYTQRNFRWFIVLWQVRGATWKDQLKLFGSAMWGPVSSLQNLREWQDPQLMWDANVRVPGIGNFSLRRRTDDLWHVLPWREAAIVTTLSEILRPGDVFVDAGANIGVYTVLASRLVGSSGRVVAIEMMPDTRQRLEDNLESNKLCNVTVVASALSDISGAVVTAMVEPGKYGQASIRPKSGSAKKTLAVEVLTVTLDDALRDFAFVKLMKMDLEGAELAALRGGREFLPKLGNLVFESWASHRADDDDGVDKYLSGSGFSICALDGNNKLAYRSFGQASA